jgi:hypothetical protein
MRAVIPRDILGMNEPNVCFVNEGIALQCMSLAFTGHLPVGDPAQLIINKGNQTIQRSNIAAAPCVQKKSNVVPTGLHRRHLNWLRM